MATNSQDNGEKKAYRDVRPRKKDEGVELGFTRYRGPKHIRWSLTAEGMNELRKRFEEAEAKDSLFFAHIYLNDDFASVVVYPHETAGERMARRLADAGVALTKAQRKQLGLDG